MQHTSTQTPASTHNTLITYTQSDKYALGRIIHENISKMAPRSRAPPKNVASLREPLKGSLAAVKGNPFAALDVYDRCYLLELPGELRNRIYTYYVVEGAEDRARLKFEEDQVEKPNAHAQEVRPSVDGSRIDGSVYPAEKLLRWWQAAFCKSDIQCCLASH